MRSGHLFQYLNTSNVTMHMHFQEDDIWSQVSYNSSVMIGWLISDGVFLLLELCRA